MFHYPKMPNHRTTQLEVGEPVWVFEKIDGTNLAWEWSPKRGWFRQATRTRLFDRSDPQFGYAVDLFQIYNWEWDYIIQHFLNAKSIVAVTELYGEGSFAGSHTSSRKALYLIDLVVDKNFIINKQFNVPSLLKTPRMFGKYFWGEELIELGRNNFFGVKEGIVAKSTTRPGVWAKVKTIEYMNKLKQVYGNEWRNFWEE